jgi:hypothetical protein
MHACICASHHSKPHGVGKEAGGKKRARAKEGTRETCIAPVTRPTRALRLWPLLRGVGLLRTRVNTDVDDAAGSGVHGVLATVPADWEGRQDDFEWAVSGQLSDELVTENTS